MSLGIETEHVEGFGEDKKLNKSFTWVGVVATFTFDYARERMGDVFMPL